MRKFLPHLLLFLVVLLALDRALYAGLESLRTRRPLMNALDLLYEPGQQADIVFLGSSRVSLHVDPETIAARTGATVLNLGYQGSALDMTAFMLDEYLRLKPAPRIVVVGIDDYSLTEGRMRFLKDAFRPFAHRSDAAYRLVNGHDPDIWEQLYRLAQDWGLKTLAFRDRLPQIVLHGLRRDPFEYDNQRVVLGASLMHGQVSAWPDSAKADTWPVSPRLAAEVRRMAELCDQAGSRLVLVRMPYFFDAHDLATNHAEVAAAYVSALDGHAVEVLDYSRDPAFMGRRELFFDTQHLNLDGARLVSARIGDALRARLPPAAPSGK